MSFELQVSGYGSSLFVEQRLTLSCSSTDPYTEPFRASLDSQTGFALLVSKEHCFVWNWVKVSSSQRACPSRS